MSNRILIVALSTLCSVLAVKTSAEKIGLSLSSGAPFFLVPEVSVLDSDSQSRWYLNYKIGTNEGFSGGWELARKNKHALGIVIGAIGEQDDHKACNTDSPALCELGNLFDEDITMGAGVTYSHYFKGISKSGVRSRIEIGYGKGVDSKAKRFDANVSIGYQF